MRRAGQHARTKTRQLALKALLVLAGVIVAGVAGAALFGYQSTEFVLFELAAIGLMIAIDRLWLPIVDRWDRGATGEETVGKLLAPLSADGWRVVHDLNTGRGNIDHVVIGPGGLFTIETKSHSGRIAVDRIERRMLNQAYAQRKWLEETTGERADALLVFSRAYLDRPVTRQRGVIVLPARMLCGHLRRRKETLSTERVAELEIRLASAAA